MSRLHDLVDGWIARRPLRRCDRVGERVRVDGRPHIEGLGTIELGDDVVLSSVPVQSHIATGARGCVRIGDGTSIGHGVSICSHGAITIGANVVIGPFAILLDVDFHEVHDRTATGTPRPIVVGNNVRIGAGAIILRGAIIGDDVEIAPNCVVSRRIPAGMRVSGVPARPLPAAAQLTPDGR